MKIPGMRSVLFFMVIALATSGCSKEARKNRYLKQGDGYFKTAEYQKAEIEYMKALQVGRLDPVAIRQLGLIYFQQGKLPQAYAFLQKAVELDSDHVESRLKLGLSAEALRDFKQAQTNALWVLGKEPGNEEALLLLAETARTPKDVTEMLQRIEKMRQNHKDGAGYRLALGRLYAETNNFSRAEAEYTKAVEMNPKSSLGHLGLAFLYWQKNDLKRAEVEFKTASDLAPVRSASRLKYADFKFKTGEIANAKKLCEDITRQAPDFVPAWSALLQAAYNEEKYDECETLIKKILLLDPANYDALLTTAQLSIVRKDPDKAIADLQRMTPAFEKMPPLHYQLALAYVMKDEVAKAMSSLNEAIALQPNFPKAILLAAELNLRRGNANATIAPLTQLIKQQPQLPQSYHLLASAHAMLKNLDQAASVYRQMSDTFPKNPGPPTQLGNVLVQQEKLAEARTAFNTALKISPDYLPASERLVILDVREKNFPAAMDRISGEIKRKPKAAEPLLLLATVHLAQNKPDEAETALLKAIELSPDQPNAYILLVQIYFNSNRHKEAMDKLSGFLTKNPNNPGILMQIGVLHQAMGNRDAARETYEKVLVKNPDFTAALNNLAWIYADQAGQLDKALQLAERARKLLPNDPSIADTLGWILYKKSDFSRAMTMLRESASKPELASNLELQFHLGMTAYMLGQEEAARSALQAVVTSNLAQKEEAARRINFMSIDPKTADADALKSLEKRYSEEPNDVVVLNRLAAIYERDGNVEKAVKTYEDSLKKNPKNAVVMMKLAGFYSTKLNQPAKALDLIKEARKIAPTDPQIASELARRIYQAGDFKYAATLFSEASRQMSNDPEIIFGLALAQYHNGQIDLAEESARRAEKAGGSSPRADEAKRFLSLVETYKSETITEAAATQAQEVLAKESNNVPALMVSARFKKQSGTAADAQKIYETIFSRNALFSPAARELTLLYSATNRTDQAAYNIAAKAREAYPSDPDVAKALGILNYTRRDYNRAVQLLKEASAKRSQDGDVFFYLGMAHHQLKQKPQATSALKKALDLKLNSNLSAQAKTVLGTLK